MPEGKRFFLLRSSLTRQGDLARIGGRKTILSSHILVFSFHFRRVHIRRALCGGFILGGHILESCRALWVQIGKTLFERAYFGRISFLIKNGNFWSFLKILFSWTRQNVWYWISALLANILGVHIASFCDNLVFWPCSKIINNYFFSENCNVCICHKTRFKWHKNIFCWTGVPVLCNTCS